MSKLYIIATPIGCLQDITARAIECLKTVDIVLCENPQHTRKLFNHLNIKQSLVKVCDYNEKQTVQKIINWLEQGKNIGMVSDAGTPLISDPGYKLVSTCQQKGFVVQGVPGPCAIINALVSSGLATDRFCFEGFLSAKNAARLKQLDRLALETRTLVFYESPRRLFNMLANCIEVFGLFRLGVLAREMTKCYETIKLLPLGQLYQWAVENKQDRGECVILLQGAQEVKFNLDIHHTINVLAHHLSGKTLVDAVSQLCGCKKQDVYHILQSKSGDTQNP